MLKQVEALLRKTRYSEGYGDRLGGVPLTPRCQQLSEPRPQGGKGGDKSSSRSDLEGGDLKDPASTRPEVQSTSADYS